MNGAGELYLGYRFHHLEVFDYTSGNQGNILVELYYMETSDDAFGLLSLDWGGEPVAFDGSPTAASNKSVTSFTRALYGGGLLRSCLNVLIRNLPGQSFRKMNQIYSRRGGNPER